MLNKVQLTDSASGRPCYVIYFYQDQGTRRPLVRVYDVSGQNMLKMPGSSDNCVRCIYACLDSGQVLADEFESLL